MGVVPYQLIESLTQNRPINKTMVGDWSWSIMIATYFNTKKYTDTKLLNQFTLIANTLYDRLYRS
mgnify:FL=1